MRGIPVLNSRLPRSGPADVLRLTLDSTHRRRNIPDPRQPDRERQITVPPAPAMDDSDSWILPGRIWRQNKVVWKYYEAGLIEKLR
jgi:hypothetical protein